MNREETRKAAEVMLHYANGGEVQYFSGDEWRDAFTPVWNQEKWCYRIKPLPVEISTWAWIPDDKARYVVCGKKEIAEEYIKHNGGFIVELKGTYTCDT